MQKIPLTLTAIFCFEILLVGCGKGGIPVVPVKGKITFAGGKAPAPVAINFVPLETENELPRIPGKAVVAEDGSYYAITDQAGQGLIPGRYIANVECWKQAPTMASPAGISHLPKDFRPAQELVVKSGSSPVEYNIDIPASP